MNEEVGDFLKAVNNLSVLSEQATSELLECVRTKKYMKGDVIHEEGKLCRNLFFIKTGLAKHFYYHKGSQFIFRFFEEDHFFIATDSFFKNLPADYSTLALEDCTINYLLYDDFERLCNKYHSFESFARKFVSVVASTAISNLKGLLYLDATGRYNKFLKEYGHLQQRISLGDTAAFLGISQVSLSRIRSKK
ncbi:Crp/Fnr family transcriptional regulator [Carboxylicivirga linearis]|uniref:Crp/Fnr family transcriptional regulator n=1 Tax=Carboxylicivirga linearis TaxID=1628157 RepID=A0ABS5JZW0_9BACT|nr:Crp/Fnr family transcriptional regulator [Carboxylicivirga linearis]MBS2100428.1 Crp/Fnr family transcriptional regulator [Carboxylicivirga linearis]